MPTLAVFDFNSRSFWIAWCTVLHAVSMVLCLQFAVNEITAVLCAAAILVSAFYRFRQMLKSAYTHRLRYTNGNWYYWKNDSWTKVKILRHISLFGHWHVITLSNDNGYVTVIPFSKESMDASSVNLLFVFLGPAGELQRSGM